jgi:hypothetical protein
MVKQMEGRKAQQALLHAEYKKATEFLKSSVLSQQRDLQKVIKGMQKMETKEASEYLQEQRGFTTSKSSTYTNAKMLEDEWRKMMEAGASPEVRKKAKVKVKMDTIPVTLGGGVAAGPGTSRGPAEK